MSVADFIYSSRVNGTTLLSSSPGEVKLTLPHEYWIYKNRRFIREIHNGIIATEELMPGHEPYSVYKFPVDEGLWAISQDGDLAVTYDQHNLKVYATSTGDLIQSHSPLSNFPGKLRRIGFTGNGNYVLLIEDSRIDIIPLFELLTSEKALKSIRSSVCVRNITAVWCPEFGVGLPPYILYGDDNGSLYLWDLIDETILTILPAGEGVKIIAIEYIETLDQIVVFADTGNGAIFAASKLKLDPSQKFEISVNGDSRFSQFGVKYDNVTGDYHLVTARFESCNWLVESRVLEKSGNIRLVVTTSSQHETSFVSPILYRYSKAVIGPLSKFEPKLRIEDDSSGETEQEEREKVVSIISSQINNANSRAPVLAQLLKMQTQLATMQEISQKMLSATLDRSHVEATGLIDVHPRSNIEAGVFSVLDSVANRQNRFDPSTVFSQALETLSSTAFERWVFSKIQAPRHAVKKFEENLLETAREVRITALEKQSRIPPPRKLKYDEPGSVGDEPGSVGDEPGIDDDEPGSDGEISPKKILRNNYLKLESSAKDRKERHSLLSFGMKRTIHHGRLAKRMRLRKSF